VLVTGGHGFLGRYVVDALRRDGGVLPADLKTPSRRELDLRRWEDCVKSVKGVDVVIDLAARVGGIGYNQRYPGAMFFDNAIMGLQLMEAARLEGVGKFVAVGTVCSYPKFTPVPFKEEDLWNGYPEETNAPYGLAKKMALVQAQAYRKQYGFNAIYLIPVNLYGPGDNFDPESSHVIPGLIRKLIEAKESGDAEAVVWGTGTPSREFLYVADGAEGIRLAAESYDKRDPVNLGSGDEITIRDLASLVSRKVGYGGRIRWDTSMPDGQPKRRLDTSKAAAEFGFRAKTGLESGIKATIEWFLAHRQSVLSGGLQTA
jgi:GDP-L-fucose synthase